MSEENTVPVEKKEEDKPDLKKLLSKYAHQPTPEQMDEWKAEFGEVFVTILYDSSIHIFHALSRSQWTELQQAAFEAQQKNKLFDQEVETVQAAMLWTSFENKMDLNRKAGTYSSLAEAVTMHSNFMDTSAISGFTIKI